jgi:hypothetical protein
MRRWVTAVGFADQASELAGNLVAQHFDLSACSCAFADPRAAVDYYRVTNSMLRHEQFWLRILDQKAHAAKVIASEKIKILLGQSIARTVQYRLNAT